MDIEAYRQRLLGQVKKAAAGAGPAVLPEALEDYDAQARKNGDKLADRIAKLTLRPEWFDQSVRILLTIAGDRKLGVAPRLAALRRLGAAKFQTIRFEPHNPAHVETLRRLATDPSARIREAALEGLTLTGDRHAQKLLRASLSGDGKPLLRTEKAVQLLARDDHASARPLFRDLAKTGKGKVREEALRALANDSKSATLFETIAADKKEAAPVREIAAASLKSASPPRFARLARKLILDSDDDDRVRAAAASAVAHTGPVHDQLAKPQFRKAVASLGETAKSRNLRKSAKRLASRLEPGDG